ncbi:uncharacterized protein LOC123878028 [Maniola jurtina]|uniref:uncharacterized protein LOC123878028 n=1 Tax=Maniola jurtina TaxID=191418 RepID=UPI001E68A9E3|nr:uncharacterized protein LOC123878028 [Maniola jurtina]
MCVGRLRLLYIVLLIFSVIKNGSTNVRINNLLQLLSNANVKPPFIAILYPQGKNTRESNYLKTEVDLTDDIVPEIDSLDPPHDEKAYLLYHVLRTTEEREHIDPEAAMKFEQTKDILRQALRKRCNQLNSCYSECPKKQTRHFKCTMECQETYDNYDVCQDQEQEKTCKRPKCGKTMPPKWYRHK